MSNIKGSHGEFWSQTRVDILTTWWDDGKSSGAIAAEIGATRSAVLGKIGRLGLLGTQFASPTPRPNNGKRRHERKPEGERVVRITAPMVPDTRPPRCEEIESPGVHIADLEPHQCRWVRGEPSALTYCGQTRFHEGTPYCEHHHGVSVQRIPGMALAGVLERERFNMGRIVRASCSIEFNPVETKGTAA